jgi:hypothetical protein
MNMALAIKLWVPWNSANKQLDLLIELRTQDGEPALSDGKPIRISGHFEVGRPPGLTPGSPLDSALAIPVLGIRLPHGTYRWELTVDHQLIETYAFDVIKPPPGFPVPPQGPTT